MSPPSAYAAYDVLPVAACVAREGKVVYANAALLELLGVRAEEVVGQSEAALHQRFIPDEDRDHVLAERAANRPATAGRPFWVTARLADGSRVAICCRRVPGPGPGEELFVFQPDEAEQSARQLGASLARAVEQMLGCRSEEEVLSCVVDAVREQGLYCTVLRLEGEALGYAAVHLPPQMGRAAQADFGVPLARMRFPRAGYAESLFASRAFRFHNDMHALVGEVLGSAAMEGLDAQLPSPRGVDAPIFVEGQPWGIFGVQGFTLTPADSGVMVLFARCIGAALENVAHHRLARERVTEVEALQAELVQKERLAVLGEAAGVMAHEVRNPLAVILNAVALLKRDARVSGLSAELVQTVDEEARRLDVVVRDLLYVTRPLEVRRSPVELPALVQRALGNLRARTALPAVQLEVPQALPSVEVDPQLVLFAVENLLRNAVDCSPSGATVRVHLAHQAARVALSVEDSGPGISEAERARIFEPFFLTRGGGSGLSLTVVKRVADAHGAEVRVADRPGGGACFTLLLPAA